MHIQRVQQFEDLRVYRQRWDDLAGDCVFRSWLWLSTWWKHYGIADPRRDLFVLLVFEDPPETDCCQKQAIECMTLEPHRAPSTLIGILPCYLEKTVWQGKVLRLLGDGEVCSEYLDLLSLDQETERVAVACANYLSGHASDWDVWQVDTLDEAAAHLSKLFTTLRHAGAQIHRKRGANRWSIQLPATWDEFLAMQSKSHRKQLRRLEGRTLESSRARWQLVQSETDFAAAWPVLIDLHQRRRQTLGEPGCFASSSWAEFHHEVARHLLATRKLRLSVLTLDGQEIAAEYHFAGQDTLYVYQGGLDPTRCAEEPGKLSMIRCVQQAIAEGHRTFDLLRGDEPYKPHWRAESRPTVNVQVVSPRLTARWKHYSSRGLRQVGRLVQRVTHLLS